MSPDTYLSIADQETQEYLPKVMVRLQAFCDAGPDDSRATDLVIGHARAVIACADSMALHGTYEYKRILQLVEWLELSAPAR